MKRKINSDNFQNPIQKKKQLLIKILKSILIPVVIIFLAAGLFVKGRVDIVVNNLTKTELTMKSQAAAYQINTIFTRYIEIAKQVAANSQVENILKSLKSDERLNESSLYPDLRKTLDQSEASDSANIQAVFIGDFRTSQTTQSGGYTSLAGWDITSRPWYKVAETKKIYLTEPYKDVSTDITILTIAAPVLDGEMAIGVAGVDISLEQMNAIMSDYHLGDNGLFVLINANGTVMYHPDRGLLEKNIAELGIAENMLAHIENGLQEVIAYTMNGNKYYGTASPIGETGWTVLSAMPSSEFYKNSYIIAGTIAGIFLFGILIIVFLIFGVSRAIVQPLKNLKTTAETIAAGNLDVNIMIESNDEIGELGWAMEATVTRLKTYINYINEMEAILNQVAEGNLKFELKQEYTGDFAKLKIAILNLQHKLSSTISNITLVADQVAEGANQISQVAQSLAASSTEQANSVDRLYASIDRVTTLAKKNNENAEKASCSSTEASSSLEYGNEKMVELKNTMKNINEISSQINKIIQTIDDIATQTNLLSLNASIEAARAGEAGKGFAVVAGEVGSLANQTTESSANTSELIMQITEVIDIGNNMTVSTAETIKEGLISEQRVAEIIKGIALSAIEQQKAIEKVSLETKQIMEVVEMNTATSEESVAASEELAAQASKLKQLVNEFEI